MTTRSLPSHLVLSVVLARLTIRRALRGKSVWLSLMACALPLVFAALSRRHENDPTLWRQTYVIITSLFAVLPPLFASGIVADEMQDETITYLWSRPLSRWTVYTGKLLAVVPILSVLMSVATGLAWAVLSQAGITHGQDLVQGIGAACLGSLVFAIMCASIGTLITKQAIATAVAYVLVLDLPIGALPFSIGNLSVTHHIRQLAGVGISGGSMAASAIWLVGIAAFWATIGFWRLSRAELQGKG